MQLKSFTAWVNLQLAKVSLKVNDLRTELEDGILLLKLVEAISGEELQGGKYYKNPVRVHRSAPPPAQRSAAHAAPRATRRTATRHAPDRHAPRAGPSRATRRATRHAPDRHAAPPLARRASSRRSRT